MGNILNYIWFWIMIIGILVVILSAVLQITSTGNPGWIWPIFISGIVVFLVGLLWGIYDYMNLPNNKLSIDERIFNIFSPSQLSPENVDNIGTPTFRELNLPQYKRGFAYTDYPLESLVPSPLTK